MSKHKKIHFIAFLCLKRKTLKFQYYGNHLKSIPQPLNFSNLVSLVNAFFFFQGIENKKLCFTILLSYILSFLTFSDAVGQGDLSCVVSGTSRGDISFRAPANVAEDDYAQLESTLVVEYWKGKNTEEGTAGGHAACNTYRDW